MRGLRVRSSLAMPPRTVANQHVFNVARIRLGSSRNGAADFGWSVLRADLMLTAREGHQLLRVTSACSAPPR